MNELKLADLGEGMHEAEIVEWLVKEGESVKLDQPIVRVETDKAIVEIPSPLAGQIGEVRFQVGQTARVGDVLVVYATASQSINGSSPTIQTQPVATQNGQSTVATSTPARTEPPRRVLAAPAVRKLAFELNVDLAAVTPSAANGRITLEDIHTHVARASNGQAHLEQATTSNPIASASRPATRPTQPASEDERQPLTGLRKRIAEHMERSWRTIPHATSFDEVDASGLLALRQALLPIAEQRAIRLTYMPLLVKLLLPVLKELPIFNASLDEERREIIYKHSYHLGIATATPDGLLVPVLRDADRLSMLEIASQLERLTEGAKTRSLSLHELSGSTFTLNNLGSFGGSTGTPIINYPEVAILAVGRIQEKAIVQHGTIIAQPRLPLSLSFDHRLIDGALARAFMVRLTELIEQPQQLMLDMI